MQPLSLWLRWGVPQDAPSLTITSGASDNTPDFVLTGDLALSDTVRFQYSTDSGFSGAAAITNTIDAAEDAANALSFATGTLANGTWYFRARIERPPRGVTAWSNIETITLTGATVGGSISLFGKWFGGFGAAPQNVGGYISLFGRHFGGFGSTAGVAPAPTVQSQPAGSISGRRSPGKAIGFSQSWFDDEERRKRRAEPKADDLDTLARRLAKSVPPELPRQPVEPKVYESFDKVLGRQPISLSDADIAAIRRGRLMLQARVAAEQAERQRLLDDDEAAAILLLLN